MYNPSKNRLLITDFLSECVEDDVVHGATWVGNANGTYGTNWNIYDEIATYNFIMGLTEEMVDKAIKP